MASTMTTFAIPIINLKRSRSDAFQDEEEFIPQQKWVIHDKQVQASSAAGLQDIWGKTRDRLYCGGKQFWQNSSSVSPTSTQETHQHANQQECSHKNLATTADSNCHQKSITKYFSSIPSRLTPNTASSAMDTSPAGNVVPPSGTHDRNTSGVSVSAAGQRQLTLNKCGGFAASFVPSIMETNKPCTAPCPDCAAVSRGPHSSCHYCELPCCGRCLQCCDCCGKPFCEACRMNSFEHRDSKTVCLECLS